MRQICHINSYQLTVCVVHVLTWYVGYCGTCMMEKDLGRWIR
jgi:hypothetical protein